MEKWVWNFANTQQLWESIIITVIINNKERETISLTPPYHFHLPHRYLDTSQMITPESSLLHIVSSLTWILGTFGACVGIANC